LLGYYIIAKSHFSSMLQIAISAAALAVSAVAMVLAYHFGYKGMSDPERGALYGKRIDVAIEVCNAIIDYHDAIKDLSRKIDQIRDEYGADRVNADLSSDNPPGADVINEMDYQELKDALHFYSEMVAFYEMGEDVGKAGADIRRDIFTSVLMFDTHTTKQIFRTSTALDEWYASCHRPSQSSSESEEQVSIQIAALLSQVDVRVLGADPLTKETRDIIYRGLQKSRFPR